MRKLTIGIVILSLFISCREDSKSSYTEWKTYAGSKDGIRYSSNDQINLKNVSQLKEAWAFSSKDKDPDNRSQNQCNPIVVEGILYGVSPSLKLLALEADKGISKWIFDPASLDTASKHDK